MRIDGLEDARLVFEDSSLCLRLLLWEEIEPCPVRNVSLCIISERH
jgi:hypothetical protein